MRGKGLSIGLKTALAIFAVAILMTTTSAATERVLHSFNFDGKDGYSSYAGLIFDGNGNLYGTTSKGGSHPCSTGGGCGTVFELFPTQGGGWKEKIIHSFNGTDGCEPLAGLIMDAAGNLYGTTSACGAYSGGTVFELSPDGSGGWTRKVLHNFGNAMDGFEPQAGLTLDDAGNLYGTTWGGGTYGFGTVFELSPKGDGKWSETRLHNFNYDGVDGRSPVAGVVFDAMGNLYGITFEGGTYDDGTVFELSPKKGGGWKEKVLCSFSGITGDGDGRLPLGGLTLDADTNLYGTTSGGGMYYSNGTVFEVSHGSWMEGVLHSFGQGTDAANPRSGLVFDAAGNLYGTTANGGVDNRGTVFELSPPLGNGSWTENVLYEFSSTGTGGSLPYAGVIMDRNGNLYGTTLEGGTYGYGTAFEIIPSMGGPI
jgi:uncharacterized repeat protein (TIGR03803 family)